MSEKEGRLWDPFRPGYLTREQYLQWFLFHFTDLSWYDFTLNATWVCEGFNVYVTQFLRNFSKKKKWLKKFQEKFYNEKIINFQKLTKLLNKSQFLMLFYAPSLCAFFCTSLSLTIYKFILFWMKKKENI